LIGRLRGLADYELEKVAALGRDAGISRVELVSILLPTLESLKIVVIDRAGSQITAIRALVFSEDDVMAQGARLWRAMDPDPVERGAIAILRLTASLPLPADEAADACVRQHGLSDSDAAQAVEQAMAHGLVLSQSLTDFADTYLYNDFVWGENIETTVLALATLPADTRDAMRSLVEELHRHEGRPLEEIESANPNLVRLAIVHGLIETTEIKTTDGKLQRFAFTPRFRGFGVNRSQKPDALSQIRLVMASFAFATRYARFRLNDPEVFLRALIDRGHAGNASPIGTDYGALVMQRIVDVEPTHGDRYQFVAVKRDTLEQALDSMRAGALLRPQSVQSGAGLFDQHFTDPVSARIRLGQEAQRTPLFDEQLLAAFVDSAAGGAFQAR
jgi:hypothetical protein